MGLAPIVLFVYNRPKETLRLLESLEANHLAKDSSLFVFCDGPKADATEETRKNIDEVKTILRSKHWCASVILFESAINKGLAASVVSGVSEIVNKFGKVIVLEDDLILAPHFLTFMNEGLNIYEEEKKVFSINGYMFPIKTERIDAVLSPLATSTWGWATWADRWAHFETALNEKELIQLHSGIRNRFNFSGYNYAAMLDSRNSWGIKWYYTAFLHNALGLFPTRSLVSNIGFEGSGTHFSALTAQPVFGDTIPVQKKHTIDLAFYALMLDYFKNYDVKHKLKAGIKIIRNKFTR